MFRKMIYLMILLLFKLFPSQRTMRDSLSAKTISLLDYTKYRPSSITNNIRIHTVIKIWKFWVDQSQLARVILRIILVVSLSFKCEWLYLLLKAGWVKCSFYWMNFRAFGRVNYVSNFDVYMMSLCHIDGYPMVTL